MVLSVDAVSWENKIFVDVENGADSESCYQRDIHFPCATINMALIGLKLYRHMSTVIYVSPGTYSLENMEYVTDRDTVAIFGRDGGVVIKCAPLAGLEFDQSSNIVIENITFYGCGLKEIGETPEDFLPFYLKVAGYNFQASLIITYSRNVLINNVSILFSNGTGLLLFNVEGNVTVKNSLISGSRKSSPVIPENVESFVISGGLIICKDLYGSGNYLISRTNITNSIFDTKSSFGYECSPDQSGAIVLIYFTPPERLVLDSCDITNNTRGLTLVAYSGSSAFEIQNTKFDSNQANSIISLHNIGYFSLYFSDVSMTRNLIMVSDNLKDLVTAVNPKLYRAKTEFLEASVSFSEESIGGFSFSFEQETCPFAALNATLLTTGTCSNYGEDYTGHCPTS